MTKLYKLTVGKSVVGQPQHDWYSSQLEHMACYGDAAEAVAYLSYANSDHDLLWPEVYDEAGQRMTIKGLITAATNETLANL